MDEDREPVFMRRTAEKGVSDYKEIMNQFEDVFFDLEKIKAIDLSGIYLIIPPSSRLKKKTIIWGFSIAKHCQSKVYIAVKKAKGIEQEIDKISKTMGVDFEFLEGDIGHIMEDIKKEAVLTVLPRDVIEGMKEEKQEGPLLII
jgi:hypothetical protein